MLTDLSAYYFDWRASRLPPSYLAEGNPVHFNTPEDYFSALKSDPAECAIVPVQMIADLRGVTRGAIVRMIDIGQLKEIKIGKTRYVRASSYIDLMQEFDRRVKRVYEFLEDCARQRKTVTYDPVMSKVGLRWQVPADRLTIGNILGAVSRKSSAETETEILLSVLVCRKTSGKPRPGDGFFELSAGLGYDWEDNDEFVKEQTERVFDYYGDMA